jgi:hypothetical protein
MKADRQEPDREHLLAKWKALSPQQRLEVLDFIDFLSTRPPTDSLLEQYLRARATDDVDVQDLRRRLAKIPGNMSDTVRALRDERS